MLIPGNIVDNNASGSSETCYLPFFVQKFSTEAKRDGTDELFRNRWVFGSIFLKKYYLMFDSTPLDSDENAKNRIGLAIKDNYNE